MFLPVGVTFNFFTLHGIMFLRMTKPNVFIIESLNFKDEKKDCLKGTCFQQS
jgi:hypothetical protein